MQFAVCQAWETGLLQVPFLPWGFLCLDLLLGAAAAWLAVFWKRRKENGATDC